MSSGIEPRTPARSGPRSGAPRPRLPGGPGPNPVAAHFAVAPDFWRQVPLARMDRRQWEALCDRCGRCCLEKLIDRRTGKVFYTDVACALLDPRRCVCLDYDRRFRRKRDCLSLSARHLHRCRWLPRTCAYRLLAEGQPLPAWHPLCSGSFESVHEAGISIRGRPLRHERVRPEDLHRHIVDWGIWARRARAD